MNVLTTASEKKGRRTRSEKARRDALNFYIYTSPWLFGFLVLTLYPILSSFWLMFTDTTLSGQGKFIGLGNWVYAFQSDPLFLTVFKNTIKYVLMFVPSCLIISFVLACCFHGTLNLGILPHGILSSLRYRRCCSYYPVGMALQR